MGYPPFAMPGAANAHTARRAETMPSIQIFLDDLPSIDDFVDSSSIALPSIDDFLAGDSADESWRPQNEEVQRADFDAEGWAISGWQSFDWNGAASLGVKSLERSAAPDPWDTNEWSAAPLPNAATPGAGRRGSPDAPPSADEVARALDGIARRIRSGELLIDEVSGAPPEAAMAAAIAALLRMRD
ncbi:MAG: hypothetical protein ABJC63_07890 [Gemmatimonadales bacterium]